MPGKKKIDIKSIDKVLEQSWSEETCSPAAKKYWSDKKNKALGQCSATAVAINMLFGGDIMYNAKLSHYWNVVGGVEYDFTKSQFKKGELKFLLKNNKVVPLSEMKLDKTKLKQRAELLVKRINTIYEKKGSSSLV